ncbi:hypothetical protein HYV43_03715 [Candidatus Micrarchaeota archaeon]|nr:hypothetical protein [Candidatus Micrarchaeota archaeon]
MTEIGRGLAFQAPHHDGGIYHPKTDPKTVVVWRSEIQHQGHSYGVVADYFHGKKGGRYVRLSVIRKSPFAVLLDEADARSFRQGILPPPKGWHLVFKDSTLVEADSHSQTEALEKFKKGMYKLVPSDHQPLETPDLAHLKILAGHLADRGTDVLPLTSDFAFGTRGNPEERASARDTLARGGYDVDVEDPDSDRRGVSLLEKREIVARAHILAALKAFAND